MGLDMLLSQNGELERWIHRRDRTRQRRRRSRRLRLSRVSEQRVREAREGAECFGAKGRIGERVLRGIGGGGERDGEE